MKSFREFEINLFLINNTNKKNDNILNTKKIFHTLTLNDIFLHLDTQLG